MEITITVFLLLLNSVLMFRQHVADSIEDLMPPEYMRSSQTPQDSLAQSVGQVKSVAELFYLLAPVDPRYCEESMLHELEHLYWSPDMTTTSADNQRAMEKLTELRAHCSGGEPDTQTVIYEKVDRGCHYAGDSDLDLGTVMTREPHLVENRRVFHAEPLSKPKLKLKIVKQANEVLRSNNKLTCRPRQELVHIPPPDPSVTLVKSCVTVKRCGGCCGHMTVCKPTKTVYARKKLLGIQRTGSAVNTVILSAVLEEHKACKCTCQVQPGDCSDNQTYDADSCSCRCGNSIGANWCEEPRYWDLFLCECVCRKQECSTNLRLDPLTCRCVNANS